ncbi:MAG: type II toxin-antitoxin system RelE/ParE family toxin [Bacteroidota bacterium]
MISKFSTSFLEEARAFINEQDQKTKKKILQNIEKAQILNDTKFFKKLEGEIWEFRVRFSGKQYRLLAFWDKRDKTNTLVIATHGFVKKRDAVPKKEIEKAESLRIQYFELDL